MAFLISDAWYEVQFLPLCSAPWEALSYAPVMGSMVLTWLLKSEPIVLYVASSETGQAITFGGEISGFQDSLIKTATPLKSIDLVSMVDIPLRVAKDLNGNLYIYNQAVSQLERYSAADTAALRAWL